MGSNGGEPMVTCENNAAECSATTVEIKIKTLDSRTFTLRVDKRVPVPELKEQIASVTGVLSNQQRLICRGKVLKDDQLLSAYLAEVEDGHTLHLVVRQPVAPMSESSSDQTADPTESNESGPGMFVGTFSLPDQGDGSVPDLSRIVSAVLNSFGLSSFGSASEGIDLNQPPPQRASASADVQGEAAQQPIVPDSLTTLLQYSSYLRQEFANVGGSQNVSSQSATNISGSEARRLLTPEFLAEAMSSVRQLISEQASNSLLQLAGQLNSQASIADSSERSRIQSNAIRTGSLFQNLGSLLLELGRAITTLRMGQSPADALVNAGPSVFVSSTRPNPIMVQPLQAGASFGSVPVGTAQQGSGSTGGSGFVPRNIDIRIRTGSMFSRRERSNSPVQGQGTPPATGRQNSSEPDSNLQNRESQAQTALPFRTVAIPQGSDSSSRVGTRGLIIPVMTRVQHVMSAPFLARTPAGANNTQQSNTPNPAAQPQNAGNSGVSGEVDPAAAQFRSSLEQFIGSMFGELPHVVHTDSAGPSQGPSAPASVDVGSTQGAVSEQGILLSNMLQQIMPLISQNIDSEPNMSQNGGANSVQEEENQEQRASSSHEHSSESQPDPKRQRRE